MAEAQKKPLLSGYFRIFVEFIGAIILFSIIGTILTFFHAQLGITTFYELVSKLILLLLGVLLFLSIIRVPLKHRVLQLRGPHFASMITFFATLLVFVGAFFALLTVLSISYDSLVVAVGGTSIVVGFAISTIATNVISGAFMLTSYPIKVGQRIIITVNNQLGTITNVGALFMTVVTDAGAKLVIPNSAVFQGMAFLLDVGSANSPSEGRSLLPKPGDRVISATYPFPSTVTEVNSVVTKILTDAGQLITIPNQAILNGGQILIKIDNEKTNAPKLPVELGDEVRLGGTTYIGKVSEIHQDYFRISGSDEDVVLPTASITSGAVMIFKRKNRDGQEAKTAS